MAKTMTKLQERIVARVLSDPMNTLYLSKWQVNSAQSLINKGLLSRHCYASMVQSQYLTPELKSIFFGENDEVFYIQDIYDNGWIIFEGREVIAKPRSEKAAERIVQALKVLRKQSPEPMCGECGKPWTGKPCGQTTQVCYPSATEEQRAY